MKDNRQKPTHPEKTNKAKRPQLQLLNLEQLDAVASGSRNHTDDSGFGLIFFNDDLIA